MAVLFRQLLGCLVVLQNDWFSTLAQWFSASGLLSHIVTTFACMCPLLQAP